MRREDRFESQSPRKTRQSGAGGPLRCAVRAMAISALFLSTMALADDRIPSPPDDLARAYAHPRLSLPLNTRAMSVSQDGSLVAYVVQMPVENDQSDANLFLATGAPASVAQGGQIHVMSLQGRTSLRICPSHGNDWDPVWSPDARRLAFYSDRDGEVRLWLYDRATNGCRRVSERPAKSLPWAHEEPRWSADGSSIYFSVWPGTGRGSPEGARVRVAPSSAPAMAAGEVSLYRHDPEAQAGASGEIATADSFNARCSRTEYISASIAISPATGGEPRMLADSDQLSSPDAPNRHFPTPFFRLSASGRWLTYLDTGCLPEGQPHGRVTRLFAMPGGGGDPILISDNLRSAVGGDERILNYRWSPVAEELVFTRDGELWRVTFGENGPAPPQRLGASLGALSPALHWYTEDGRFVLVGTHPIQRGRALAAFNYDIDLALVPVDGGDPVQIPVDRTRWEISGVVARNDRALLQPSPTSFRLLGRNKQTGENVVLTFDWASGLTTESWRGRGRFHEFQAASNGQLLGIFEDFQTAPNIFRFPGDLSRADQVTDISPGSSDAASSTADTFETVISQHDGSLRTVRTAVLLPPGARRGDRLPAVVWFYPGEDLTSQLNRFGAAGVTDPAYLLTSRGYAIVLTNVAIGPGEQRGHVIDEIMDSLMPQVHRAADLGYVDINRLALRGHSFGGFGTLAVTARTNLFRGAIASSGVYDLGGSYGDADYVRGELIDRSNWSETSQPRLGQPIWDDPLRYIQNSPYYLADRIRTPILIIQGTEDFGGASESGKMFAALRRLNRPVELALYQGGGHVPAHWPLSQAVDQMARTIEFLGRHIGPGWSVRSRPAS